MRLVDQRVRAGKRRSCIICMHNRASQAFNTALRDWDRTLSYCNNWKRTALAEERGSHVTRVYSLHRKPQPYNHTSPNLIPHHPILPPLLSPEIIPAIFSNSLSISASPVPRLTLLLASASLSCHAHSLLCCSATSSPPHPHTSKHSISKRSCQSFFFLPGNLLGWNEPPPSDKCVKTANSSASSRCRETGPGRKGECENCVEEAVCVGMGVPRPRPAGWVVDLEK